MDSDSQPNLVSEAPTTNTEDYKTLANDWLRFVGQTGERDKAVFLTKTLKQAGCREVFDAGLGIGGDTISLKKDGFAVQSNEIDPDFEKVARGRAAEAGIDIQVEHEDWRDLGKIQSASFDAVVLTGNSLTQLFSFEDALKALKEFHRILRFGGVLVIDERNYQAILDNREKILENPLVNFRLRFSGIDADLNQGRTTYSGEGGMVAAPTMITDEKVTVSYFDLKNSDKILGGLTVYPFKRGELAKLIKQAGFSKITQYSDWKEGFEEEADFYEYVAIK